MILKFLGYCTRDVDFINSLILHCFNYEIILIFIYMLTKLAYFLIKTDYGKARSACDHEAEIN